VRELVHDRAARGGPEHTPRCRGAAADDPGHYGRDAAHDDAAVSAGWSRARSR
jgi:hypothetical protein